MKYLNEFIDLEDILDSLIFEDEPSIFDEKNTLDLIETALYLMEDYMNDNPTAISEPDFEEELLEDIKEIFYIQFEEEILNSDWIEDDLNELLEEAFFIFITIFNPERSINVQHNDQYKHNCQYQELDIECSETVLYEQILHKNNLILEKIEHIKVKPQPTQRTDEWYKFRHNLITASNAYKAFESQATINQLIYEKCQPLKTKDDDKGKMVNINTPFHWGQKYEPLSVMIYENMYNTKVADFGCIQHDQYKFLGASPDGINVDINSERFGRMLEIKNIVNREINGIPKKEYWVQMQLQMEVCDLNECDFLETKFIEYENSSDFFKEIETDLELQKPVLDDKGVILYFHDNDESKPFYVYKPLNIVNECEILKWEEEMIELYQSHHHNYLYIKTIYWKLEKLSCVLVLRNQLWFKNNIQAIENIWNIIEKERVTGYEHRAPNKKNKINKDNINPVDTFFDSNNKQKGCLIKIMSITKTN
jgi:putative phage-type endonuclease